MFPVSTFMRRVLPVSFVLLMMGCSSEITPRSLVGTWGAADKSGVGTAFKIKSNAPDAKGSDIVAVSQVLAATMSGSSVVES